MSAGLPGVIKARFFSIAWESRNRFCEEVYNSSDATQRLVDSIGRRERCRGTDHISGSGAAQRPAETIGDAG